MAVIIQELYQPLFFGETITSVPTRLKYIDSLALTDSIQSSINAFSFKDTIELTDSIITGYAHYHFKDFIQLTDKASAPIYLFINHSLAIVDGLDFFNHYYLHDTLNLLSIVKRHILPRPTITQDLALVDSFTLVVNLPNVNDSCISPNSSIALSYGTFSISLPAPDYGNGVALNNLKINTRNRGNQLIYFRDSSWYKEKNYKITLRNLGDDEKNLLLLFLYNTLGLLIDYTDVNNVTRSGIITTQEPTFSEERNCAWKVDLELQVYN